MPCLFIVLAAAFPRIAILLLWFFTRFFNGVFQEILIPILGFLFLPLTLIVYTFLQNSHIGTSSIQSLVFLFLAVIFDLGLVGSGTFSRRRSV